MSAPKFRYIIVTPENDVFGTDNAEKAAAFDEQDDTFVVNIEAGTFTFNGRPEKIEELS